MGLSPPQCTSFFLVVPQMVEASCIEPDFGHLFLLDRHLVILLANARKSAIERGIHLSRMSNQETPSPLMDLAGHFS